MPSFSILFQEQKLTDNFYYLLIYILDGGHKWTRTIDLTLIRRAL